jgi:hypothetical protein
MYLFLFALSLLNGFLVSTERPCSGLRLEGRLLRDKGLAVNILYKQLGHPKMGGPIILYSLRRVELITLKTQISDKFYAQLELGQEIL